MYYSSFLKINQVFCLKFWLILDQLLTSQLQSSVMFYVKQLQVGQLMIELYRKGTT